MSDPIVTAIEPAALPSDRSVLQAVLRGLRGRCPACGEPLGSPPQAEFNCTCGRTWRKNGEIYDFRYAPD